MIILEGPDGTGKTTLAEALAKKLNGMVIHAGFDRKWDIRQFHSAIITSAYFIENAGCPVIIDRWAVSEAVYGRVFRGGEAYDTAALVKDACLSYDPIMIYCRNDNAVANHLRNKQVREEMFGDISEVVATYEQLLKSNKYGRWIVYDYDKNDINKFVEIIACEYSD